jgi:hypothetical protein
MFLHEKNRNILQTISVIQKILDIRLIPTIKIKQTLRVKHPLRRLSKNIVRISYCLGYSLEFLHDFNLCIFVYPISFNFQNGIF